MYNTEWNSDFVIIKGEPAEIISGVASVDNWRGEYVFIYCVLHHQYLLKSIVFKVCEHKYMNIRPSNYRRWLRHWKLLYLTCRISGSLYSKLTEGAKCPPV